MGSTTIILRSFDAPVFKVTEFENTIIKVKPFQDTVIVVPGDGEEVEEGIFDDTFDDSFE